VLKTKSKVIIILANQKGHSQSSETIKARSHLQQSKARENVYERVAIGSGYINFSLVEKWHECFFKRIT